jgi:hypothetical protein
MSMDNNEPIRVLLRNAERRVAELETQLADARCGITIEEYCTECGQAIDPDTCHCGETRYAHNYYSDHSFVPMGCACGYYVTPDAISADDFDPDNWADDPPRLSPPFLIFVGTAIVCGTALAIAMLVLT